MSPPNSVPPGDSDTATEYRPVSSEHRDIENTHCGEENEIEKDGNDIEKIELEPLKDTNGDEDGDDELEDAEVVVPPDGGWGWWVVFASFMCNMIVDGIIFSFAAFLKPITEEMHVSDAHVALVGSLMSGFYLIAGPFASALANRYGFRLVAIVGSILSASAFALSYFAPNVEYLCFTFGFLGGVGFGLVYVPAVITVGFYFERWRALATGIAVCGSGIGAFLFSPLTIYLIDNLGWRSALLCHGAIAISCLIFGLFFKPLKPKKLKDLKDKEAVELVLDASKLPRGTRLTMEKALGSMRRNSIDTHDHQSSMLGASNNANYPTASDLYHAISVPHAIGDVNTHCREKRLSVPSIAEHDKSKTGAKETLLQGRRDHLKPIIVPARSSRKQLNVETEVNRPLYRSDIFLNASLTRLSQYKSNTSIAYNLAVTHLPTKNDIDEEKKHSCKMCPEAVRRTLATMLDFSLLKSPTFLTMAFSGFLTMMGFYTPFMYLTKRAEESGLAKEQTVFLIGAIGIANTLGRVLCGVLSSFPGVDALFVTNAALTIGGIATIFSGYVINVESQYTYTAIFGLSTACFASLRSIIVVDLLGLEKLTNAFGLLLLFQGMAAAIGAPLAGAFASITGSYDASFYLSGGLLLASAVMCYPLHYINRREMDRMKDKTAPV